ncbi:hypothetical protein ACTMSW_19685 [Micromonospora sp. BQ11]|uniref:hypothetical protein n=1 Tax=Micromonospora sp. BQ11 TaxID=3452212 RepID=UPI003F89C963
MTHRVSTMDQHRRTSTGRGSVPRSGPAAPAARSGPAVPTSTRVRRAALAGAVTPCAAPAGAVTPCAAPAGASARP